MNEQELLLAARDAAREHIRVYVERGDSLDDLRESPHGSYSGDRQVVIGSSGVFGCRAKFGTDSITVTRVNGVACCHCFRLSDIYAEVRSGMRQAGLPL